MNLALFDLDNTLLAGDSDYEWGQYLIAEGVVEREAYEAKNAAFFEQYKAGTLDIHEFLAFALKPLADNEPTALERWRHAFVERRINPMIGEAARLLVKSHLGAGDLCAVVTATNSFVTRPIADAFGIAHLIATDPEAVDGRYTGRVQGTPCFQEGKIERVTAWLAGMGKRMGDFPESSFYSDSRNDIPLLERVTRPVAVDPDDTLRSHAASRGWPIITLRP